MRRVLMYSKHLLIALAALITGAARRLLRLELRCLGAASYTRREQRLYIFRCVTAACPTNLLSRPRKVLRLLKRLA